MPFGCGRSGARYDEVWSLGYDRWIPDMRASERLLEYVASRAELIDVNAGSLDAAATPQEGSKILEAVIELE